MRMKNIILIIIIIINLFMLQTASSQNKNIHKVNKTEKTYKNKNTTLLKNQKTNVEKDKVIESLRKEKENILVFGISLFSIFIFMFFMAGMKFKKINDKLRIKNSEIAFQREEIQKQKDSITQKTMDLLVLNKELKENNELRGGLSNMIVHDLKNPISNIINLSENREITFFAKDMLTMVENILDIQKYEGMIMPLNLKNILLKNIVTEAVVQVSLYAEHKNIKIENKVSDKIVISADEDIIRRVFVNLLSNAVKYTFNNGLIKIESEINSANPEKVKVSVIDNGIGIKEDKIPLIFNKFSQIIARKTGEARSTGIGLTFCKMAVEAHESEITVESVPNEFTSFCFFLPLNGMKKSQLGASENIREIENFELNVKEKAYLQNFYNDFNLLEVYEISELRIVLNKIDENFSENVKKWKNELNNAIYNCNFELYNKLKEIIN